MNPKRMSFLAATLAIVLGASLVRGQGTTLPLQQALDRPITASIEDAPIVDVFRRLTEKTGVRFVLDEQSVACLPYGDQTRLIVRLKDATLRKDLSRVLAPACLQWTVEGDFVRIVPQEALARMCRRASYDELQALSKLYAEKVSSLGGGSMIDQLKKITGNKDLELLFQAAGDKAAALAKADAELPATGAEWLDRLCQQGPWTWYLWGDQIIVLDRKTQIARQLQQIVSLRYQNEKLFTVLLDLARKARVKLEMEPGVLTMVPAEIRTNFNLVMADATVAQALEMISGATGLEFIRTEEGLRAAPSEKLARGALEVSAARRTPFFVRMTMPGPGGTTLEVFFRPDELPDGLVQQIEAEKQKVLDRWKAGLPTGVTTAPAAEPK